MSDFMPYNRNSVLIHKNVALNSSFDAQTVFLTGAQVGILRSISIYLNDRKTFVSEYEDVGYLWPLDDDWDLIQAIVADLEKKLMGDDNTAFGFNERYAELVQSSSHASGAQLLETTPVPAGYVYVVENMYMQQNTTASGFQHLAALADGTRVFLDFLSSAIPAVPHPTRARVVLEEGDFLRASWGTTVTDETILFGAWGYKMKVPE